MNTNKDLLKRVKKFLRDEEILLYGKSLGGFSITRNKKRYIRKEKHKSNYEY